VRARAAAFALALAACASPAASVWLEHGRELAPGVHVDGVWCSERIGPAIAYSDVRLRAVDASGAADPAAAERWLRSQLRPGRYGVLVAFPRAGLGTHLDVRMTPLAGGHGWAVEAKLRDWADALLCEFAHGASADDGEAFARSLRAELVGLLGQGLPTLEEAAE
jgi:hypothetical protein